MTYSVTVSFLLFTVSNAKWISIKSPPLQTYSEGAPFPREPDIPFSQLLKVSPHSHTLQQHLANSESLQTTTADEGALSPTFK